MLMYHAETNQMSTKIDVQSILMFSKYKLQNGKTTMSKKQISKELSSHHISNQECLDRNTLFSYVLILVIPTHATLI